MVGSLAQSFESAGMIDAIQSGTTGTLAVSLVFFSQRNQQVVAVEWMEISDANSAIAFAAQVRAGADPRPFRHKKTAIADAIDEVVPRFRNEGGNQAIFLVGDGIDHHSQAVIGSTPRDQIVSDSRDAALRAGVEIIGALTVGATGTVDDYFEQNVVGGAVEDFEGGVVNAEDFDELVALMDPTLQDFVLGISQNPEPDVALLVCLSFPILARRRRTSALASR